MDCFEDFRTSRSMLTKIREYRLQASGSLNKEETPWHRSLVYMSRLRRSWRDLTKRLKVFRIWGSPWLSTRRISGTGICRRAFDSKRIMEYWIETHHSRQGRLYHESWPLFPIGWIDIMLSLEHLLILQGRFGLLIQCKIKSLDGKCELVWDFIVGLGYARCPREMKKLPVVSRFSLTHTSAIVWAIADPLIHRWHESTA